MTTPDKPFEQRARELYLDAARQLDPATAGRLRAARREALAAAEKPVHHATRWLIPSGACAAIALAAVLAWPSLPRSGTPAPTAASTMASATENDNTLPPDPEQADPNLVQNLDFYGWLAANDTSPPSH